MKGDETARGFPVPPWRCVFTFQGGDGTQHLCMSPGSQAGDTHFLSFLESFIYIPNGKNPGSFPRGIFFPGEWQKSFPWPISVGLLHILLDSSVYFLLEASFGKTLAKSV